MSYMKYMKKTTIAEVLAEVDEIKPNTYDDNMKIKWLAELDQKIFNDVIATHVITDDISLEDIAEYSEANMNKELFVPFPYSDLYRNYVFAMIDYSNGETDRYQNSMIMFNTSYQSYTAWYNRTHRPISKPLKLF